MNMFITRISPRQRGPLSKLLTMMLGTILLGGVSEISVISKKNMTKQAKISIKLLGSTTEIQSFTHSWE